MKIGLAHSLVLVSCAGFQDSAIERRGPDRLDMESTRLIREHTTDPSFLTEWVDHLPEHDTVPSPREFLGYGIGAPNRLTQPEKIAAYFRELAKTSDRVKVFSAGRSDRGREMIVAAIADADVLARLDAIKGAHRELSDPRATDEKRAREIAASAPPIYWVTAGLHSPETGPPEMVMELAYRLAVSEQDHIREIRRGVVTLITPVLELEGRARMVDWYNRHLTKVTDLRDMPPSMAPYWGDYTAHDNNRDGLQQSQRLTRNYTDVYYEYLPVLSLDLHESVPLLYVSMGTGPYNATIDPITVSEWQWLSGYEVAECTKLGLRGVWTWGFYDGWYPGYLLWVTNNHNATGRFYETFGNGHPGTFPRRLKDSTFAGKRINSRQWYRAWPPEKELTWSLRNNTNYMQTGVLASLQLAARNGGTLLWNFWRKGVNALEAGRAKPPYAFVIPAKQRDRGNLRHLLWLLDRHRIEVHVRADGDYVVRMDQPYRNFALSVLRKQEFPESAEHPPYDDVAWSFDLMLGVEVKAVDDKAVLDAPMRRLTELPEWPGTTATGKRWIVDHRAQTALASLAWAAKGARALAAEWNGHPAGSLVFEADPALAVAHRVDATPIEGDPPLIEVDLPRVALFHTWGYTQDSGWARFTLEQMKIPFALINKDHLRRGGLRERHDVIIVPSQGSSTFKRIVHDIDSRWSPLAYTKTAEFPSHGEIDAAEDITGGMGFEGLANLERFVREGGLLVTLGSGGLLPADGGIARDVTGDRPEGLLCPGSHVTAKVLRPEHPIAWGYPRVTHVFRGNHPRFTVRERDWGMTVMQYGTKTRAQAEREADQKAEIPVGEPKRDPATKEEVIPFVRSGMVKGVDKLERAPAVLDVPVGKGRVVIFSWNPLHRHQNWHDFGFFTNALLFWNDFPPPPTEEEMMSREP
ncbi:MAG: hypothetical protein HY716_09050 [Planctomycetes bacterium]|nr:hypothetical protein [Planctomycetota bacterium]